MFSYPALKSLGSKIVCIFYLLCKSAKCNLGLIRRQFNHAPPSVHHKIYKSVILPKLEHCTAVWDPYFATDESSLENVQKFAVKIVTNQWNSSYSDIRTALNWQTLESRRNIIKLKVCYNILNHYSCIPSSSFTPIPTHPPDYTLTTKLCLYLTLEPCHTNLTFLLTLYQHGTPYVLILSTALHPVLLSHVLLPIL